jgi:hypothetical protein
MKSNKPLMRVRSFLLSWLGIGLSLWVLPGAKGQTSAGTCTLTSPTNGSSFAIPGSFVAAAAVTVPEDGLVNSVDFLANGALVASISAPPYSVALNLLSAGTLTLQAILTDDEGFSTTSAPITVTITGTAAPPTFTGASNLVLWLKADAGVTNTINGVSGWADQSAYGNNAISLGSDPALMTDAVNGQPAVGFDSTNFTYLATAQDSTNLAVTGDIAGLAVINVPAADWADEPMIWFEGGNGTIMGGNNGYPSPNGFYISTTGYPVFVRSDGLGDTYFFGAGNEQDTFTGNAPLPAAGYAIVGFSVTNGAMTQYLNGLLNGSYTATVTPSDNDHAPLYIGARASLDDTFLTGNIAELMIFNSSLWGTNLDNIQAYLETKYGILVAPFPDLGPVVSSIIPTNGGIVATNFVVTATVIPPTNAGIATVELFTNGVGVGTLSEPPWQWSLDVSSPPPILNVPNDNFTANGGNPTLADNQQDELISRGEGPIVLSVVATDNQGVVGSATSTVTVAPAGETCTLTSPANDSSFAAPGSFVATAAVTVPTGGAVAGVSFLANGVQVANIVGPPYSVALNVPNAGPLTLQAILTDANGWNIPSAPISVTVSGATPAFDGNSNLVLWLEADAGVVTNANGTVIEWTDQSAYENNAISNGVVAPILVPNAVNGEPAIAFSAAVGNYLFVPNFLTLRSNFNSGANVISGFAVINVPFVDWTLDSFGGQGPTILDCPYEPLLYLTGGVGEGFGPFFVGGGQPNFDGVAAINTIPVSGYAILGFNQSNGVVTLTLNGALNGEGAAGKLSVNDVPLYIGGSSANSYNVNQMTGDIAELMIFNSSLPATNLASIEAYLGTKYGISLAAPADPGPAVSILTPANGAMVPGLSNFVVTASVTNTTATGIAKVQLFTNGSLATTLTAPPWQWTVYATPAPITLTVAGTDNEGVTNSVTITVTPTEPGETCTLVSPANNSSLAAPASFVATADVTVPPGHTVAIVSFLANGAMVGQCIAPPYSVALNALNPQTLTLQAILTDNVGFTIQSEPVNVVITGAAPTFAGSSNSNLVLWLEAGAGVTNTAQGVTGWADQSAYGNDAISVDSPPALITNAVNGQPAIAFDGSNTNYLMVPDSSSLSITGDIAGIAVIAASTADLAVDQYPYIWAETNGNELQIFTDSYYYGTGFPPPPGAPPNSVHSVQGGHPVFQWGVDRHFGGSVGGDGYEALPTSGFAIVCFSATWDAATSNETATMYLNGAFYSTTTRTGNPLDATDSSLFIGQNGRNHYFLTGDIAELMLFNSSLSGTNLADIQAYLGTKYGMPLIGGTPDFGPGLVSILTPTNGASVFGLTNFVVTATATPGTNAGTPTSIATMELFVNGAPAGTLTNSPYQWAVYAGSPSPITLTVTATDNQGVASSATSTVTPTVAAGETCTLTSPANGSSLGAPTNVTATATVTVPPGDAVASVSFLANGYPVGTLTAPPYTVELSVLNPGTLTLQAILTDTNGFVAPPGLATVTVTGAPATFAGNPNLVLWLEAGEGVTTNASGVVGWADQSGNNNNAVATGSEPTLVPDAIGGQPAIAFNADLTNFLQVADSSSLAITGDISGIAVIAVPAAAWADDPIIWLEGGGAGNCSDLPSPNGLYLSATGQPVFERGNGLNCYLLDSSTATNPLAASGFAIVSFSMTNGAMAQYLNGAPNGTSTATYNGQYADTDQEPLYIGASGSFDDTFLTGDIAELMLFNASMGVRSLDNIYAYLGTKYGFSLAVPPPPPLLLSGPAVAIMTPTNGGHVPGIFKVTATATPATNTSIATVQLFVNGGSLATLTAPPYQWTVCAGSPDPITLTVTATDNQDLANSTTNTVTATGPPINLVQNGGFETGTLEWWTETASKYTGVAAGSGFFGDYGISSFSLTSVYTSQTLATTPGVTYDISCWYNCPNNPNWGSELSISWNGVTLFQLANTDLGWTNIQLQASATSASTVLDLGIWNGGDYSSLTDIEVFPLSPALGIARQGTNVVIAWPETYSSYTLQSATNLSGAWAPVSGVVSNQLIVTPSLTQQFYRLAPP